MKRKALNFFKKAFTTFFLLVYSFTPSVQAIDEIISMDDSQDILEEGISDPVWIANGDVYTISNIVEGETYSSPQNSDVTVTFTKLPENPSTLSIREITLTDEEMEATGAVSDKAYDITTDMADGTFEYDLTLPLVGDSAKIGYVENESDLANGVNEMDSYVSDGVVKSDDIDHFTVFLTYADASFSTVKTNYVRGETVYMKATGLTSSAYYRIDITDPNGASTNVVSCQKNNSSLPGNYSLSSSALTGNWSAVLTRYSSNWACNNKWYASETENANFTVSTNTVSNPSLTQSCGLDIALVIDISSSINSTELGQMKSAMISFVDSLEGTPTQFSVTKFGTNATVVQSFTSDFGAVRTAINGIGVGISQGTNWEEGISTATSTFDPRSGKPNLMIFASDGNPTFPNCGGGSTCQADVDAAVTQANIAKSSGIRILALGIGDELNVNNLKAISGNVVGGTNLLTADVITTDFTTMSAQLADFASQTCGGTISVNKYLEDTTTTGGSGWIFTLSGTSGATLTTDANGQANTGKIATGTYSLIEGSTSGYSFLSAECKDQDNNIVGTLTTNGIQNISVNDSDIVTCNFVNTAVCTAGQHILEGQVKGGSYTTGNLCSGSGDCWSEGENVPARLTVNGLVAGRQYSVVLEHDYKDSNGKIGYENFNSFSATGASGLSVSLPVYTSSDSTAQYTVSFTAISSTVVLNWNALLSEEAGQWNGASLHYRLVTGACGGAGNKDIPINPGKIVVLGSFTPVKSTENGADPSNWTFNLSGLTNVNGITSGETASDLSLSTNNGDATYTIAEVGPSGWELVSVSSPCFVDGSSVKVILTKSNPDVSCTFVNKLKTGKIIVDKVTNPSGDSQVFGFTVTGSGYSNFSLKDSDTPNEQVLVPGTYTVSENSISGWTNTNTTCVSSIGDAETIGNLELDNGETITCTFTNTKYAGLTIVKDANPDSSQDFSFVTTGTGLSAFSLDDDTDPALSNTKVFTNLLPGTYSVAESAVSGWDSSVVCSDGSSNTAINLSAGENVICTFTNVMRGSLGGHKYNDADGDVSTTGDRTGVAGWTIELWQDDVKLNTTTTAGVNGTYAFTNLVPGTYQLRESLQLGWYTLYPASYDDYITVTLLPGQNNFGNDFINVEYASVTILKNVDTDGDGDIDITNSNTWTWDIDGNGNYATGSIISRVTPGTYTFSEDQKDGYHVTSLICNNGIGGADNSYGAVESQSISVSSGQNLVCTFTNTRNTGTLRVVKVLTNDNGGSLDKEDFSFKINNGSDKSFEPDGVNEYVVPIGTYSVAENSAEAYTASYNNCENAEVTYGNTTVCTITNDDIAPSLTLNKTVTNDNGGNASASDWTLTATGPTTISGDGTVSSDGTFDAGTYTLSENSSVTGYTAGNWNCVKNGGRAVEGSSITLGLGDTAVCTIVNNDIAPTITLTKVVTNNNGGTAGADDFGLTVGSTSVTSGQTVSVSANTPIVLNETGLTGYSFVSITGDSKCPSVLGGTVTLNEGENISCTITNDDQAGTLIVRKVLVKDDGGSESVTDFKYKINDGAETAFEADGENSTSVNAGIYTVTEVTAEGYTTRYNNCTNVVVSNGETEICTITNDDIAPKLTIVKTVVNDNGGNKNVSDFHLYIDSTSATSGTAYEVEANKEITVSEDAVSGYTPSVWGGDCSADGKITLLPGENKTCTITNDDQPGTLIVKKILVKDNGGNESVTNFGFRVNGGTRVTFESDGENILIVNAGRYTVAETPVNGYTTSYNGCTNVRVSNGETKTCTITNNDIAPSIKLNKLVINNNGGSAGVNRFGLTIGGTSVKSGQTLNVDANEPIAINEAGLYGYRFVSITGDDKCPEVLGDTVTLNEGESITCNITNDDIAPKLTLNKILVNDNGGNAVESDWLLKAVSLSGKLQGYGASGDSDVVSGSAFKAGTYLLSELGASGYSASNWSCVKNGGSAVEGDLISLNVGDEAVCTIINDDIAPTLKVIKRVVNNNGGNDGIEDFGIKLNDTLLAFDAGIKIGSLTIYTANPTVESNSEYTLSENDLAGYAEGNWHCVDERLRIVSNPFTLNEGQDVVCTIRNNDIAPTLTVIKEVVNDNGGNAVADDFNIKLGESILSFDSGTTDGDVTTYTSTPVVISNTEYILSEDTIKGYTNGMWSCMDNDTLEAVSEPLNLTEGQNVTCTITNDDIAPKLTLVKEFEKGYEGATLPDDFDLTVGGSAVLSGVSNEYDSNTEYAVDETQLEGFVFSSISGDEKCPEVLGGTVILDEGDDITCTITNDVIDPVLQIEKGNNTGGMDKSAGDSVVYTITVTALEVEEDGGDYVIKGAELRDILPAGFSFVSGSWTATKNGLAISLTEPLYGSTFAEWNLGDILEGDVIVLSYTGNISATQDAGLYKDYAWVSGTSLSGNTVLGNADTGIFVGTQVNVVENYIEEGQVLGITDHVTLPDTGADTILTLGAILTMILGLLMLLFRPKKNFLISVMVISLLGLSFVSAEAADKLLVDIEQPASLVNTQNFKIGFVVANTTGDPITVQCIEETYGVFDTYTGINAGDCIVNSSVVPADGTYTFYVIASDSSHPASESDDHVTVTADFVKPFAVLDYEKIASGCSNVLTFTTANDGQTSKIQIFRSTNSSFTANSSTLVKELTAGPNENVTYTDDTAVCGVTYYYAVRALDTAGNTSDFVADKVVVYVEAEDTEETTGTGEVAGEETSEEETGNTQEDTSEEEDNNGEVKGETTDGSETEEESGGWTWVHYTILSAGVILLVYVIYRYVKSKRQRGTF